MKILLMLFIAITLQTCNSQEQKEDKMWNKLKNTTWRKSDNWAGQTYVFYEDVNGNKKCLHQISGSGTYVTMSNFVDVSFLNNYKLVDNKLISDTETLTLFLDKPMVYSRFKILDIEEVKRDTTLIDTLTNFDKIKSWENTGFKIHIFNREDVFEFPTETYEYGEGWHKFLNNVDLEKTAIEINTKDIEHYNWQEQKIILTENAQKKLQKYIANREKTEKFIEHNPFLVTLNGKRIYAGSLLNSYSAMAIVYPVIYFNRLQENKGITIQIFPLHTIRHYTEISREMRKRTATKNIKKYFMQKGLMVEK